MTSNRTEGSLNLQPMNSSNYTAALDGVQSLSNSKPNFVVDQTKDLHDTRSTEIKNIYNGQLQVEQSHGDIDSQITNPYSDDIVPSLSSHIYEDKPLANSLDADIVNQVKSVGPNSVQAEVFDIKESLKQNFNPSLKDVQEVDESPSLHTNETETELETETETENGTSTNSQQNLQEETRQLSRSSSNDADNDNDIDSFSNNDNDSGILNKTEVNHLSPNSTDENVKQRQKTLTEHTLTSSEILSEEFIRHAEEVQQSQTKTQPTIKQEFDPKLKPAAAPTLQTQAKNLSSIGPEQRQYDTDIIYQQKDNAQEQKEEELRKIEEMKLEHQKMEQFKKLNNLPMNPTNPTSQIYSRSMSPMSPKTTNINHPQQNRALFRDLENQISPSGIIRGSQSISQDQINVSPQIQQPQSLPQTQQENVQVHQFKAHTSAQPVQPIYLQGNTLSNTPPKRSKSPFRDPSNLYLKQINDQRRPLYTPAVLRVADNSSNVSLTSDVPSPFDVHSLPCDRPKLMKNSSAASIGSTSSVREYWNYLVGNSSIKFEEGPTRNHWKADSSRFSCAGCGKIFNYMTESRRKHHCRSCGEIFCGDCLKNYIYLDQNAQFTLFGSCWDDNGEDKDKDKEEDKKYLCKVCHPCAKKYEEYVLDHTTRDHNLGASGQDGVRKLNNGRRDTVTNTGNFVPADWDWSSF